MTTESYEQCLLIPNGGTWFYNAETGVVSDKIDLGKDANASAWMEITDAKKQEIEQKQKEAVDNGV